MGLSALLLSTALVAGCGSESADEEVVRTAPAAEPATPATPTRQAEAPVEEELEPMDAEPMDAEPMDADDDIEIDMDMQTADADDGDMQMASAGGDLPPDHPALGGDATAGKRVFARCMSCHSVEEGQNRVGPSLYGIIGRPAGEVEGFNYTDANANSGIVWTKDVLFEYLEDPQGYIPGTRMIFPGLPKEEDRRNVIAYLEQAAEE
jgi:cytochrome c